MTRTPDAHDAAAAAALAADLAEARRRIVELESANAGRTLSLLARTMLDGFALFGADGVTLDVNPALCAMTGFGRDELVGHGPPRPYWPPEEEEALHAAFDAALHGEQRTFAVILRRRDDTRFPALISPGVLIEESGETVAAYATLKDISDCAPTDSALGVSEKLLRLTFEQAPVGAALIDRDLRYQRVNSRFSEMTGYSAKELLDRRFPDITHPDDADADVIALDRLATGESDRYDTTKRYLRKDGTVIWCEVAATPVFDQNGKTIAFVTLATDITARRETEAALRESEEHFRSLVENMADVVGRYDRDLRCRYLNPSFERVTGVDPHVLLDKTHLESSFVAHLAGFFTDSLVQVLETGETLEIEWTFPRPSGDVQMESRVFPERGCDGRPSGVITLTHDVTARKRAEDEIRRLNAELQRRVVSRTERMQAASRDLEALAYSISHDVRAPLRAIDGFSALVMEAERDCLSAESLDHLRRVRVAAQTLGQLMDDLTELSNLSRRDVEREVVDLTSLAEEVGEEAAAETPSRDVELSVQPGMTADADPKLLRVIVRELLDNAWKFTAERAVAHVEVGALDEDGERAFFVRDDGAGFDMRYAEHLFGVFQRMHQPGRFEGDGVGLAIVQRLVRRHGGRIWADAEVDIGATFYFTLPAPGAAG